MVLLTTVESSFEVPGQGCWIVPAQWKSDLQVRQKDKIQLRTPGGNILNTHIGRIERVYGPSAGVRLTIGLPRDITKEDVPGGTEIWLVDRKAN